MTVQNGIATLNSLELYLTGTPGAAVACNGSITATRSSALRSGAKRARANGRQFCLSWRKCSAQLGEWRFLCFNFHNQERLNCRTLVLTQLTAHLAPLRRVYRTVYGSGEAAQCDQRRQLEAVAHERVHRGVD